MMSVGLDAGYGNGGDVTINLHPRTDEDFERFRPMFQVNYRASDHEVGSFVIDGVDFRVFGPNHDTRE